MLHRIEDQLVRDILGEAQQTIALKHNLLSLGLQGLQFSFVHRAHAEEPLLILHGGFALLLCQPINIRPPSIQRFPQRLIDEIASIGIEAAVHQQVDL